MDFEKLLIKNLLNPDIFSKVFHLLEPKYFGTDESKGVFKLVKKYHDEYREVPGLMDIVAMIKDVPNSDSRKNLANFIKEIKDIEQTDNPSFFADETVKWIKDALYFEALMVGSDGLQKKDDNLKLKAQAILDKRSKITIDNDLGTAFADIDKMLAYFSTRNVGILSQHKELNKRLGVGFLPGTLSVICAAQGVGKSLMLCDLISGFIQNNKNILLVSLEMSEYEMVKRIYANVFNLDVNHFADLSKTKGELAEIPDPVTVDKIRTKYSGVEVSGKLGQLYVKEYPAGSFSALMLEELVKKYQEQKGIKFDLIMVDYLGISKSDRVPANVGLYSYIKAIGEEFRATAVKLQVPIISCSQLNRSAINQTDSVDNANLADSIATAMTADFILFLLSNEEMKEKSQIIMKVTKNRFNGLTDQWLMDVDYPKMRFSDHVGINGSTFSSSKECEVMSKSIDNMLNGLGL